MNLILWIGFIGLIIPGAISSKHHDASKNTFNMNHIRRNKNHKGKSSKQSMILQVKVLFISLIRIHSGNNYFICSVSEGKERWIADSKILDQELKQEEQEKVIAPAEFTDKHQDLKIEGKNNDPVLPDFIDNGGIKGHSEMYDYGEDFDCDNDGNKTGKL